MNLTPATPGAPSPGPISRIWQSWSNFWFRPTDPTPLGLMRILTGMFTFYVVLAYTVDLQELLGKDAWLDHATMERFRKEVPHTARPSTWNEMPRVEAPQNDEEQRYLEYWTINPRVAWAKGQPIWSIWFHVTDPVWMNIVHAGILVIVFLFTIGAATRITSVLTWFGVISYTQRAITSVFGMDTMMNILLIYMMIGPSGAALSVDRLVRRYWIMWRALRARKPAPETIAHQPLVSANFTIRLIQVHLCIIYLAAGLAKRGEAWWNGRAVWGTLANPEFSPMHFPPYLAFLRFLSENRWLWEIVMNSSAVFTLAMEIGFPVLIWVRPLRWVMLGMAVMMHLGIAVFMGLNTFSLFMGVMLIAFVPPEAIRWFLRLPSRNAPRMRLMVNTRVRSQVRAASVVRAVDVWEQVELVDAGSTNGERLRLVTANGETITGMGLVMQLVLGVRMLIPLVPMAWLLEVSGLGRRFFQGDSDVCPEPAKVQNGIHRPKGEKVAR